MCGWTDDGEVAIMLVTNYMRNHQDRYLLRAIRTDMRSSREKILRDTAVIGLCEIVSCTVSSHEGLWLPGQEHPVYIGKRIDREIQLDEPGQQCEAQNRQAEDDSYADEQQELAESEELDVDTDLMQSFARG